MATALADSVIDRLRAAVPAEALVTDADACLYYAQDVHRLGPAPLAVLRPAGLDELTAGIGVAAEAGLVLVPRGGGMSYTSGYVADAPGALIVDLGRMDRVLTVDAENMTVTVEAGCTWATLYGTLRPLGLCAPVWGTLSGSRATVGGGMSQNGLFWGAGRGSIAATALSMRVVLADGRVIQTGSNVLRPFGPDVTGLFAADAGAFGIKVHVTLPLIREAAALGYASYAFDTHTGICGFMSEVGRAQLATECFGFDPFLQAQRMKRDSLAGDAKQLLGMMKAQGGFWRGLKEGAKVVAAGHSFLDDATFSSHLVVEGRSDAAVQADLAEIARVAAAHGGSEVENSIPKILRANPFPPVNSILGPAGERWVPVHGIVAHDRAAAIVDAVIALYDLHADDMERLGIGAGYMFVGVGTTGILIEPVFYYPGRTEALHRQAVEPAHLARLPRLDHDEEARALVDRLRAEIVAMFGRQDGVHFQIGRTYPLRDRSDPAAWDLLETIKTSVDPNRRMNPGVLGL